ncbi:MAG: hypothetical protein M3081_09560, partial [Gemmatimonadota bacterium]|nr:hypothetical protein [Gemmatimonadota bacterium]
AHPEHPFVGSVEKIEPQAVIQQSVTMFPVLVSVSNEDRLLMPGMNGEVSILVEQKDNVIAVPNDAVRNPREAAITAPMLGLDPAAVQKQIQDQMQSGGGQRIRMMGGQPGAPAPNGKVSVVAKGEVVSPNQGPGQGPGGFQMPEVTQAQCDAVKAAFTKHPEVEPKLMAIRDKMRAPDADRTAIRAESEGIYKSIGLDPKVAGACRMKERMAQGGGQGGPQGAQAPPAQNGQRGDTTRRGGRGNKQGSGTQAGQPTQSGIQSGPPEVTARSRSRLGLVFVADSANKYTPRIVRLGISNFDYSEVISGLKEGDQVVLVAALAAQANRNQQVDQMKQRMGGGVPGMQQQQTRPGGGGAARPPGR